MYKKLNIFFKFKSIPCKYLFISTMMSISDNMLIFMYYICI